MDKKLKTFLIGFNLVILLLGIAGTVYALIYGNSDIVVNKYINLATYAGILFYVLWGYKKPHGNLLRYTMWLYALSLMSTIYFMYEQGQKNATILGVCLALVCYVSGRLNRIDQNPIIMTVIAVLLLALFTIHCISYQIGDSVLFYFALFSPAISWTVIASTYFVRYEEHNLAGLVDDKYAKVLSDSEKETVSNVWMHL